MFDSCAILPLCDLSILFSQPIMLQLTISFAATWKNRNLSDFLKKQFQKTFSCFCVFNHLFRKNVILDLFTIFWPLFLTNLDHTSCSTSSTNSMSSTSWLPKIPSSGLNSTNSCFTAGDTETIMDNILTALNKIFLKILSFSGTVDNLTANSSPVQRTVDDPTPGQRPEVIAANKKAYG